MQFFYILVPHCNQSVAPRQLFFRFHKVRETQLMFPRTRAQPNGMALLFGSAFNALRPRRNRHYADYIFKCIFLNENVEISIRILLKFVPKGPIYNIAALVLIMAWRRPGDKPLSQQIMVRLLAYICVTRPQWVNYKSSISFIMIDRK